MTAISGKLGGAHHEDAHRTFGYVVFMALLPGVALLLDPHQESSGAPP
jgi:hypothetical protein